MPFFENFIEKMRGAKSEEVVQEKERTEEELRKELKEWEEKKTEVKEKLQNMRRIGSSGLVQKKMLEQAYKEIEEIKKKLGISEPGDPDIE